MLKNPRLLLIAAFFLGSLGAAEPPADSGDAASATIYSSPEFHSCEARLKASESELCAQWIAADAAKEAVHVSWLQFYTAFGATVVSFFTLAAAVVAALYAKNATNEAKEANRIAKNADRPWVFAEAGLTDDGRVLGTDKIATFTFEIELTNEGSAPAVDVYVRWHALRVADYDIEKEYDRLINHSSTISNPLYLEPFKRERTFSATLATNIVRSDGSQSTSLTLIVYYKSPHSPIVHHTCVFFDAIHDSTYGNVLKKRLGGVKMV